MVFGRHGGGGPPIDLLLIMTATRSLVGEMSVESVWQTDHLRWASIEVGFGNEQGGGYSRFAYRNC